MDALHACIMNTAISVGWVYEGRTWTQQPMPCGEGYTTVGVLLRYEKYYPQQDEVNIINSVNNTDGVVVKRTTQPPSRGEIEFP